MIRWFKSLFKKKRPMEFMYHPCPECGVETVNRYCTYSCGLKATFREVERDDIIRTQQGIINAYGKKPKFKTELERKEYLAAGVLENAFDCSKGLEA